MTVMIQEELASALEVARFTQHNDLLSMHLNEIEDEAANILDLLIALRAHGYRGDTNATQESLAEITIALEHLIHHSNHALPSIQQQLDLAPD